MINEFLNTKSDDLMASLWKEKVYEGSEIGNAYWLIANQLDQAKIIKEEIEKLHSANK